MQFPFDWYAQIPAGFIYAILIYLLLPQEARSPLSPLRKAAKEHSAAALVILVILSYVLGSSAYTFFPWIRDDLPFLDKMDKTDSGYDLFYTLHATEAMASGQVGGYLHMVFLRSMLVPCSLLGLVGIVRIWKPSWPKSERLIARCRKVLLTLVVAFIVVMLWHDWWHFRGEYFDSQHAVRNYIHKLQDTTASSAR